MRISSSVYVCPEIKSRKRTSDKKSRAGQCDRFIGSVSTPSLCVASSLYVELVGIGCVCAIPTRESFSLGARRGLYVISHVLKVMPRDIITQMSSID